MYKIIFRLSYSSLFLVKQELWGNWFKTSTRNYFLIWFTLIKLTLMEMGLHAKYLEGFKKQLFLKDL